MAECKLNHDLQVRYITVMLLLIDGRMFYFESLRQFRLKSHLGQA